MRLEVIKKHKNEQHRNWTIHQHLLPSTLTKCRGARAEGKVPHHGEYFGNRSLRPVSSSKAQDSLKRLC